MLVERTRVISRWFLFSVLAVAGLVWNSAASANDVVERILAIVNDEIVTLSDVTGFEGRLKSGGPVDDLLVADEAAKKALIGNRDKILETLIDSRLLDGEVRRRNLSVTVERVEQEIRMIARQNNLSRDELKAAVGAQGMAFSQYQEFIKTGLERRALIDQAVVSRIRVSEDDITSALRTQGVDTSSLAFDYTLAHIFFDSRKPGGPSAAQARASAALKRLQGGREAFDRVAADTSEARGDDGTGTLGTFRSTDLTGDLETALRDLKEGQFTGVLPTSGGFHIVRLTKKVSVADPKVSKERDRVRAQLSERAYKRQFASWLEQLRQDAFLRINR
jgi:peptidyl-prolyl cis-trans isomerase SurA